MATCQISNDARPVGIAPHLNCNSPLDRSPHKARVVSDVDRGAPFATQHVSSQRRAAALFDRRHDLQLPEAQVGGLTPRGAKRAKDVCHLERAMRHDGDLLGMQTLKRADHLAQNVGGDLGVKRCGLKLLMA
jgi:hypothetical protein